MKKKYLLAGALTLAVLLGSCQANNSKPGDDKENLSRQSSAEQAQQKNDLEGDKASEDNAAEFKYISIPENDYPRIDGSTATLPLSYALYRLATGEGQDSAIGKIVHNKTTESYIKLINREVDIILSYAPPQELMEAIEEAGEGKPAKYIKKSDEYAEEIEVAPLLLKPVGKDALVFLVNQGNPVSNISEEDIVKIYTGKIDNWKELGGSDAQIKAFQRPEKSGSQNLMEKLVMKDNKMIEPYPELIATEMGDLIERVASYDNTANALGYSVYYYAKNMKNDSSIKFLSVNRIAPDDGSIRNGDYPYTNEFYAAIRADTDKNSYEYKLFEWLTGDDGQALVNYLGYVGVSESGDKTKYKEIDKLLK